MRINDETCDECMHKTAVTLGKFNAMHLGHRRLIKYVCDEKKNGFESVVFSFDTTDIRHQKALTTKSERAAICEKAGVDNLVFYPVNRQTMSMEPEAFIEEILHNKLHAGVIVTGKDFCFGRNRRGNVEMLKKYAEKYSYKMIVSESIKIDDEKVSSSAIKTYLKDGNIEKANKMLGYEYFFSGKVVAGKQIGRTIGTRTINIVPQQNKLIPLKGVYKTRTWVNGEMYKSVTNIGTNPTVKNDDQITVETHILEFDQNIYNFDVKIDFLKFIREEKKFSDLDALKRQILLDISEAN